MLKIVSGESSQSSIQAIDGAQCYRIAEKKLNELAELLAELEQTPLSLKAMKNIGERRLLLL
jgi:hypothetical protein